MTRLYLRARHVLALLLCTATGVRAQASPDQVRRADSLFAEFTVGDSPGLAVSVVRDGKVLFAKGYGLANIEHRIPNTASTVFDVASVSKQFAGLAVAMLVQQGKVALTDDIRKYIPELQVMPTPITVDHLLHHTSGMRDWPGTLTLAGWRYDDVISFDQILTMAFHQRTLNFVPGAEYTYSNTGYNLLAEMVKRVTGTSFRSWTNDNLFRPLSMTSSVFRDDHTLVVPRRAMGYSRGADGRWHAVTNNLTALGSSSLMSSVDDMARWLMNFDDARVGGSAAMALSRTRGVLNDGSTIPYAFGISHGTYRGSPTLSHSGSWAAFVSFLVQFPQEKAGVVVLANTPSVNTARAANALADIFLGDALAAVSATTPSAPSAAVAVDAAQLDRYTGVYKLGPAWYVRIRREASALIAHVPGEPQATMTARTPQEFWVQSYGASMTFADAPTSPATHLTYRGRRAVRVDEGGMTAPRSLAEYGGIYESDELGIAYPVEVRGNALVVRSRQHGDVALTHRWRDDFSGTVGGFRAIEFQRDRSGRIIGFVVNIDERSRNIRFVRR
ncbi:MAG: serine hydrolase domain-containing protein [Gemmatimonas sp.]